MDERLELARDSLIFTYYSDSECACNSIENENH